MDVQVYNSHCSSLHKDGYILINHRPCKITDISTPHGAATVRLVCIDLFTGKRFEELYPPSQNVVIPNVSRYACRLISINEDVGELEVMDDVTTSPEWVAIPGGELGQRIRTAFAGLKGNTAIFLLWQPWARRLLSIITLSRDSSERRVVGGKI